MSMFMQKSIKIFHSVQEIRPFSLLQNLALGKASTDDRCHFAIVSLFSEFEPRQNLDQSQVSFDNLMGYILSISICMQNFITIFHSVQEIGPFSLFQNLELGKASTEEKCHFAISWARSSSISMFTQKFIKIFHSRDRDIFTFSEFEPRLRLGQSQMTFDNPLGYILSISMRMQNFIKIFQRFKSYRHFSRTGRGQNLHKQSKDKIFTNCPVTKSNV